MTSEVSAAPLGIPLHVELGQATDREAIEAACRVWEGAAQPGQSPLRIRLARGPGLAGTSEPRVAVEGRQVHITGPSAEGQASADTLSGSCAVSDDYLAAPDRLREEVLEPLVLFLLARNGRTPIHGSAFIAGNLAILACGPSGAGKSSLALAADLAGWPVLSDDTVFLQQRPRFRVWGFPGAAHLLPGDCHDRGARTRTRNGRVKLAIPFRSTANRMASAERATLCILAHGDRVALEPLGAADAARRLRPLEAGFDLLAYESAEAFDLLTGNGAWMLTLSTNPAEAIELLADNLHRLDTTAVPSRRSSMAG